MRQMLAIGAALLTLGCAVPATASALSPARREAILAEAGKVKTDLCEYKECGGSPAASEYAEAYAEYLWGGKAKTEYCEGPYEDVRGKTQWACFGHDTLGFKWQVNVSAWGELTYYHED